LSALPCDAGALATTAGAVNSMFAMRAHICDACEAGSGEQGRPADFFFRFLPSGVRCSEPVAALTLAIESPNDIATAESTT